ncbi:MAG: glycosyltransferase [Acidimicrobiales bacterium]
MKIVVEGNLSPAGSYGIVNANLGRVLSQRGHEVAFVGLDITPSDLSALLTGADFDGLRVSEGEPTWSPDVRIRQVWPPIWVRRRPEERLVVIQPWEFGSVPLSWREGINNVDAVWVPSEYCKRGYIQSGVDPAKVWVVPNGFDIGEVNAAPRAERKRRRLLYLGGTIFRKGVDVLVDALDALDDTTLDQLDLIVKDVGHDTFYKNQSLLTDALIAHPRVQSRTTIEGRHLERSHLLDLIADADALVHPYRAEGFGMPMLEAMALGTLVIHTQGGASNEFCGPGESLLIPSSLTAAEQPRVGDSILSDQCYWLEPSREQLSEIIGNFIEGRTEVQPLVTAAKLRAQDLSWSRVGEIADRALGTLLSGGVPIDSLSGLVDDVSGLLGTDGQSPAPLLSRLVAIGDLRTAFKLAEHCEQKAGLREVTEIASVRERLASIMVNVPDVWSGGPYRMLLAQAELVKDGHFGHVHDFEGGDQATYVIAKHLSAYLAGCKSVLDLACGQGSMSRVLRSQGKTVQGVEADPALVRELRADGFTIHEGYLPGDLSELELEPFDGVFLGHIVEHLHPSDFEKLLAWIYENIADSGTVLIQTPDFSNMNVGLENFWLDSTHIRPYPIRLLKAMLSKSGFVPIDGGCRRVPEIAPLDVIAVARRIPRAPSSLPPERFAPRSTVRVGHYALFSGASGFAQASGHLFDHAALLENGIETIEISVDQDSRSGPSARPTIPLRFSEHADSDIAVIDVPIGWLADVSPHVRAKYRIARTTFEATPLALSNQGILRSFDEVWTFSQYDAEILANSGVPADSIFPMPPGIEVPDPQEVRTLRAQVNRDTFKFLSIFSFEPRKNPEALMRAFVTVAGQVPRAELFLKLSGIGAEEFGDWLRGLLSPIEFDEVKDRIRVAAGILPPESMRRLYLDSDVFVLPTRGEGYGLPFLEALAHGVATICPDIGGHREFCNERNSLLVKSIDRPAALEGQMGIFRESFWREVEPDDLAAKMFQAASQPERLADLAAAGMADAAQFAVAACQAASEYRLGKIKMGM